MTAAAASARTHPPRGLLWFGVFGAPLAWGLQEWLGWLLAAARCDPYTASRTLAGQAGWLLTVVHVLALAVAVAALLCGLRGLRRLPQATPDNAVVVERFLASAAIVISAVGLAALVWASLGTYLLPPCEAMR